MISVRIMVISQAILTTKGHCAGVGLSAKRLHSTVKPHPRPAGQMEGSEEIRKPKRRDRSQKCPSGRGHPGSKGGWSSTRAYSVTRPLWLRTGSTPAQHSDLGQGTFLLEPQLSRAAVRLSSGIALSRVYTQKKRRTITHYYGYG